MNQSTSWFWPILTSIGAGPFHHAPIAAQPLGPAPLTESIGTAAPDRGRVAVYSQPDPLTHDIYGHSRYTPVAEDGNPVRHPRNQTDKYGSGPTHIPWLAGKYRVRALGAQSNTQTT